MPVQSLMQDLLINGIDLGGISKQAQFKHSTSMILDGPQLQGYLNENMDRDTIFKI